MSQKTGMAKQNSEQNEPSVQLHGTGSDPDYSYTKLHNTEILTRKVDLCFFFTSETSENSYFLY